MLQITAQSKILLAIQSIDFRSGIDGIAALCRQVLDQDPMNGTLFVFRNRLKTMIRVLCYDGQGFWLCTKRLSSGRFKWWPNQTDSVISSIDHKELYTLIYNGNPVAAKFDDNWKPLTV
jgi:transposase